MKPTNFADFVDNLSRYGERLAITAKPFIKVERLTYSELRKRAFQTANYLSSLGIKAGDRIMVASFNSPQWVELFLGSQLIGSTLVTVDVMSSAAVARIYIEQTKPKLIFRGSFVLNELDRDFKTAILDNLDELVKNFSSSSPGHKLSGEEIAVIVFTSGTTAAPKGVALTQKNILTNVNDSTTAIDVKDSWRFLSVLPLSHMYELTGGCLVPLSSGSSIYYLSRITPSAIAESLEENRITVILGIPQLLSLFLDRIKQTATDLGQARTLDLAFKIAPHLPFKSRRVLFHSVHKKLGGHLDLIVTGGAPIPKDVAIAWEAMGVTTLEGYGLTETSPILTLNTFTHHSLDSQGQPLGCVSLRVDPKNGEIEAKGPSIFKGYWQNAKANKEAFTSDGWFRTGDIGSLDNNWLRIKGRLKFAIVLSSGLKVFPEDIELLTEEDDILKATSIVGLKTPEGEQVQAVVLSSKGDEEINRAIAKINNQLESFQHISSWQRWPESDFPRTRLLKIDRNKVQKWANTNISSDKEGVNTKETKGADTLLNIIGLITGHPETHLKESDNLADIGLDSLRRLTLVSLLEERMSIAVNEEQITQKITIADLRKIISSSAKIEPTQKRPTWPFNAVVRLIGNSLRETLVRLVVRYWVRLKIEGRENLAELTSPALIIFNHVDNFDGPIIYKAVPHFIRRRLSVATAADVMSEHKVLAFVIRFFYAGFSFARKEPFIPSLEYVGQLLDSGYNVALSPEGRISTNGELQPFKEGVGLLAVELQAPVVIVKTTGLKGTVPLHVDWPQKHSKATARISRPMYFSGDSDYKEVTKILHKAMEEL